MGGMQSRIFTIDRYVQLKLDGDAVIGRRCPDGHVIEWLIQDKTGSGKDTRTFPLMVGQRVACAVCGWIEE